MTYTKCGPRINALEFAQQGKMTYVRFTELINALEFAQQGNECPGLYQQEKCAALLAARIRSNEFRLGIDQQGKITRIAVQITRALNCGPMNLCPGIYQQEKYK